MANPFLNPIFAFKSLKSYLFDLNRIWHLSPHKLKRFQDKAFKQAVKYAYTVPLYNKKFKELNIHPNDINGINDINKLPLVSKNDIRGAFPDGVIPKNVNKEKLWRINTSGSTSKPLSFYRDTFSLFVDGIYSTRALKFIGINWKKDRITIMGPFNSVGRGGYAFKHAILNNLKFFSPLSDRTQLIAYINKDLEEKFEKINTFKPDYIWICPGDLQAMTALKKKGLGKDFRPKVIGTSGGMLDEYARSNAKDAFQCRIVDMYSSVEISIGAVQCKEGNYHVFSDHIFLEVLDDNGEAVSSGEKGHVVVTRFFGKGTPFVRYTGMEDIVTPIYEKCPCGLNTQLIKNIEGRESHCIFLPDGTYVTPVFFTRGVDVAMRRLKTDKVLQYQVVQESLEKISILVIIDDSKRDSSPSVDTLLKEIKKEYQKIFDETFEFEVKEVKKVIGSDGTGKPAPIILSKLNKGNFQI